VRSPVSYSRRAPISDLPFPVLLVGTDLTPGTFFPISIAPAFVIGQNHQLGLNSRADLDNTSTWGWFVKAILDKETIDPFPVNVSYLLPLCAAA
jgi:hypothetical protein